MPYHPDREDLERFARSEVSAYERRKIEDHLRSGCGSCQRMVDDMLPGRENAVLSGFVTGSSARDSPELDRALERLQQKLALITQERSAAPCLVSELMEHGPAGRVALVRNHQRFQNLAVCDLLLEVSFEEGFRDPARSIELAELAIEVSCQLCDGYYGKSVVQDLKARSWAYLGNARRISSDLAGAEQAIIIAAYLAEHGSGDPLEEARILDFKASLLSDLGWFEEASEVLDLVIDIYDEVREIHRKGRAIISKGVFTGYSGRPEQAIELISEGLSLIDWSREPRLVLIARNNFAWFLNDCGRCAEACQQLESFRDSYKDFPDPWTELRLTWLQGRIAAGLERFEEAEGMLRGVRRCFVELGLGYDASVVTLDLATLYLKQGKGDEVKQLAASMFPILVSEDVHGQAVAALALFQQFAEMDRATLGLVQEITAYLFRARKNPRLSFSVK